jgi:hypothetical protein
MIASAVADMPMWRFVLLIAMAPLLVWLICSSAIGLFMKKEGIDEKQGAKTRRAVVAKLTITWTVVWTFIQLWARYSSQH